MPLGYLRPMLKSAKAGGYAIPAFNMIDYNSGRAIVDGAQEMDAPIIVQLSVKTIKLWGFKPIASWVHGLAAGADVPVALHLDHCKDLDVIRGCIDAGWTSVMFDGSALPLEENIARSQEAYELARASGVGLEAELGAIGGTEDDKFVAEDEAILAKVDECIAFCAAMPELATFAPAIGTAHGFYVGEPKIAYDRLEQITAKVDIPIALHGGTGLTQEQFDSCISRGCAKINISTMHKQQFIEGFADLRVKEPKNNEPIPYIAAQYEAMKAGVKEMIGQFHAAGKAGATAAQ